MIYYIIGTITNERLYNTIQCYTFCCRSIINFFRDQTIGIFLIACSEEMLFRGVLPYKLRKLNPNLMILVGSIIYALAYWGSGVAFIIVSFIWGLLAFILRDRIKNIIPLIFAHFLFKLILSI